MPIPANMLRIAARTVGKGARDAAPLLHGPSVRPDLYEPVVRRKFGFVEQAAFQPEIGNPLAAIGNDEVDAFNHGVGFFGAIAQAAPVVGDAQVDRLRPALRRDEALELGAAHDLVAHVDDFRASGFAALLAFAS